MNEAAEGQAPPPNLTLRFDAGTLVIEGDLPPPIAGDLERAGVVRDDRIEGWRAPGDRYREVFATLHRAARAGDVMLRDEARNYEEADFVFKAIRQPRDYQREAVAAWEKAGRRGQIILPTGAGKSFVAQLAIASAGRSALIVVPTLDLMHQWYAGLLTAFAIDEVGLLGGGSYDVRALTVSTYDSFVIHMARLGARFGLIVFDECHHLPAPAYLAASSACIAPYRLGLTATPERQDGRERLLDEAVGPICFRREIKDMAGGFLAEYDVVRIGVGLSEEEQLDYDTNRNIYRDFIKKMGIRMSAPDGWGQFIMLSSRSPAGRAAMKAWRAQKRLSMMCEGKKTLVEQLIHEHADERVLVFTNDNPSVYELSRRLLIPAITHQTPIRERREILQRFTDGVYRVVVTAKVLNEGVDLPEASVAIILSGSGSVREHVQRLGRVLRPSEDKFATLYEVVSAGTAEEYVSDRRREHDAYR